MLVTGLGSSQRQDAPASSDPVQCKMRERAQGTVQRADGADAREREPSGDGAEDVAGVFDVAISFTAMDGIAAELAEELSSLLTRSRLRTFFFREIEDAARVLGDRLSEALPAIYRDRSLVVVLVASPNYGKTPWTRVELEAALARPRDDDGRSRLVPISSDGSRVPGLPPDVVHLGDTVNPQDLRAVVTLLLERCGKRLSIWSQIWPLAAVTVGAGLAAAQWLVAGAPDALGIWIGAAAIAAAAIAAVAAIVPPLWMRVRQRSFTGRLGVVPEGLALRRTRALARTLGMGWAAGALLLAAVLAAAIADARLRVRDIQVLLSEGAVAVAIDRFAGDRDRLSDFERSLIRAFHDAVARRVEAGGWPEFPQAYERLVRLSRSRSSALEETFWKSSGVESLRPGADVQDHISAAYPLRTTAPDLADRLFQTALARQLEWVMDGNDFYYGQTKSRPWSLYRELKNALGQRAWLEANYRETLSNNLGLSPRLAVKLMGLGDESGATQVIALLSGPHKFNTDLLHELAEVTLPEDLRARIAPLFVSAWRELHARPGPTPEGFVLSVAIAAQVPSAEELLVKAARSPNEEQERAHAIRGLMHLIRDREPMAAGSMGALVANAAASQSYLMRMAVDLALHEERRCSPFFGGVFEKELRDLAGTPSDRRSPALSDRAQERLTAYRQACGNRVSSSLVALVEGTFPSTGRPAPYGINSFGSLKAAYEALGPVGGSWDIAGEYVRLLRAMGSTRDPEAAKWLEEQLDLLAHGNMRIAAAESLLELRLRFGAQALAELERLANMESSIYRPAVIEMVLRNVDVIGHGDPDERARIVAILSQVNITGESPERGLLLDALRHLVPDLARRRALSMTFSSRREDQLEGLERLWLLWQAAT